MAIAKAGTAIRESRDQRASQRHIEQSAPINDWRTDANERAKRADECRRRHKKRVRRANVVVAASEEVPEFVRQRKMPKSVQANGMPARNRCGWWKGLK